MLFNNDFDLEIKAEVSAAIYREKNPYKYTEEDLQRIVAEQREIAFNKGYEDGRKQGEEDSRQSLMQMSFDSLESMKPSLQEILLDLTNYKNELAKENLDILENFINAVIPSVIRETCKEKIYENLKANVENLIDNKWVEFRLSKEGFEFLNEDLEKLMTDVGFKGEFKIKVSDEYSASMASIPWESGDFLFNMESIKVEMLNLVKDAKSQLLGEKNG